MWNKNISCLRFGSIPRGNCLQVDFFGAWGSDKNMDAALWHLQLITDQNQFSDIIRYNLQNNQHKRHIQRNIYRRAFNKYVVQICCLNMLSKYVVQICCLNIVQYQPCLIYFFTSAIPFICFISSQKRQINHWFYYLVQVTQYCSSFIFIVVRLGMKFTSHSYFTHLWHDTLTGSIYRDLQTGQLSWLRTIHAQIQFGWNRCLQFVYKKTPLYRHITHIYSPSTSFLVYFHFFQPTNFFSQIQEIQRLLGARYESVRSFISFQFIYGYYSFVQHLYFLHIPQHSMTTIKTIIKAEIDSAIMLLSIFNLSKQSQHTSQCVQSQLWQADPSRQQPQAQAVQLQFTTPFASGARQAVHLK